MHGLTSAFKILESLIKKYFFIFAVGFLLKVGLALGGYQELGFIELEEGLLYNPSSFVLILKNQKDPIFCLLPFDFLRQPLKKRKHFEPDEERLRFSKKTCLEDLTLSLEHLDF